MKKFFLIFVLSLIGLFILLVLYLNYQTYFSSKAIKGKKNIENIMKIDIGMGINRVDSIMGKPDMIIAPDTLSYPYTQLNYLTNDDSFASVTVVLDSNFKVKETYYPREK